MTAAEYERRVQQMADALHEDCILKWRAEIAVNPRRNVEQHLTAVHYGQAHDLVRRIFGEAS